MSETEHFRDWDGDCTLHREVDRPSKEEEQEEEEQAAGSYGPPGIWNQGSSLCTRVSKESNLDGTLSKRHKPRRLALPKEEGQQPEERNWKGCAKRNRREDEQSFQSNPRQDKETPSPNSLSTMLLLLLQQQPIVQENGTPKSVC